MALTRPCQRCGKDVSPYIGGGKIVIPPFCSRKCSRGGDTSKQANSIQARKFLGSACEACGTNQKLIVHHIDQDNGNNVTENIQTLCKPCHDFWHSLAKRVGREIAGRMPNLKGIENV